MSEGLKFFEVYHLSRAVARGGKIKDARSGLSLMSHLALLRLVAKNLATLDENDTFLVTDSGRAALRSATAPKV